MHRDNPELEARRIASSAEPADVVAAAVHPAAQVRLAVVEHPLVTDGLLDMLTEDPDPTVAASAGARLSLRSSRVLGDPGEVLAQLRDRAVAIVDTLDADPEHDHGLVIDELDDVIRVLERLARLAGRA